MGRGQRGRAEKSGLKGVGKGGGGGGKPRLVQSHVKLCEEEPV